VATLARAQAELGAQVTVLCVNHERSGRDVTWSALEPTGTRVETEERVLVVRLGRLASVAKLDVCAGLVGFFGRMRSDPPDVVHLHVPNPTMLLALASAPIPAPLVVTYHSDIVLQRLRGAALRVVERRVLGRAARILCTSPGYAAGSVELARHHERVEVLPFGIDLEPYLSPSPAALAERDRLLREHGSPLWLCVGRLVYYKGLKNAVAALPQVPGKLLMVGTGPLRGALDRQAADLGVAQRIVWLDRVSPTVLQGAYRAATALWFPSNARSEAFGLVQVEAMASGCPVINTAIPHSGVPWVSSHGESGLTIPVDDPVALARAARLLAENRELRERLAARAVRRSIVEFDHRVMARRSLELYEDVMMPSALPSARASS
jgi:glycosyltransferase involved in cell wall biosynthesis